VSHPADVRADPAAPDTIAGLSARPRLGHIELSWDSVPGAAGYVIERAEATKPFEIVRHGGSDVPAVVESPFADTGLTDGVGYTYRVGAIAGAEYAPTGWVGPVTARTAPGGVAGSSDRVRVQVDAGSDAGRLDRVWQMIGSERLTQLLPGPDAASARVASEFADALRLGRTDLGARMVRAHGILHDDNGVVVVDRDGALRFDFARVDAIYDRLLGLGLRPVVELSFMPAALARDPERTVFSYRGIISPPRDWDEWRRLVTALASRLVSRYGIDEVAQWAFEVWNEPDLYVFWSGTRLEYLRLYDESAPRLPPVGPGHVSALALDAAAAAPYRRENGWWYRP
jgi:xylan 1,4-beta-xylosidase